MIYNLFFFFILIYSKKNINIFLIEIFLELWFVICYVIEIELVLYIFILI